MAFSPNQNTYPTITQAWGIVGVLILAQIIASPIQLVLGKDNGLGLFLMYTVALSFGLAFAIMNKSRAITSRYGPYDSLDPLEIQPLIEQQSVYPSIYLLSFMALPSIMMISMPIANIIPTPEFFIEQLEALMDGDIGVFHFLTIVVAAALFEEAIFRGVILDGFLRRYTPKKAILYSAFLFALVHMNPVQFPHTFILGIFIGWIYYRTQSIWPCIAIHMLNNGMAFTMASRIDQSEIVEIEEPDKWPMLMLIPIGIVILYLIVKIIDRNISKTPIWYVSRDQEEQD